MSQLETPEQRAANDALDAAVQQTIDAYDLPGKSSDGGLVVDYLIVTEHALI
jgi:hypothetical protein